VLPVIIVGGSTQAAAYARYSRSLPIAPSPTSHCIATSLDLPLAFRRHADPSRKFHRNPYELQPRNGVYISGTKEKWCPQMGSIIPFLGDGIGLRDSVFEPHEIKAMSTALDEVCEALKLHNDISAKQVMAARIIDLVRCGERSTKRLRERRFTRRAWLRRDRAKRGGSVPRGNWSAHVIEFPK
jgi:hypothetical protein